jgi:hypothetical protein
MINFLGLKEKSPGLLAIVLGLIVHFPCPTAKA